MPLNLKMPYFTANKGWGPITSAATLSVALSLSLSLSLCLSPPPSLALSLISGPWALRKVTLSFWWCFDSSLPLLSPPTLPFHPLSPTGKLESHYHQGAKKGLVPSAAEWRDRRGWGGKTDPCHGKTEDYLFWKMATFSARLSQWGVVSADMLSFSSVCVFSLNNAVQRYISILTNFYILLLVCPGLIAEIKGFTKCFSLIFL